MIQWKLVAIEYTAPHGLLRQEMESQFNWFNFQNTPQAGWTLFQKRNQNGEVENCLIHWRRIEYKVQNCSQELKDYSWNDLIENIWKLKQISIMKICSKLWIKHKYTRPRRPQTNWKIERFRRILKEEFTTIHQFDSWKDLN